MSRVASLRSQLGTKVYLIQGRFNQLLRFSLSRAGQFQGGIVVSSVWQQGVSTPGQVQSAIEINSVQGGSGPEWHFASLAWLHSRAGSLAKLQILPRESAP